MNQPVVVAYGLGRDSTAMLVRMHKLGWRPDAIVWANVRSEKEGTYKYVPIIREWLRKVDFPPLTIVTYQPRLAPYFSLEGNMVKNATLPGATFNLGSCTMKFKVEPQLKWARGWPPAREAWAAGQKVLKLIGFEAGEEYRQKRADCKAHAGKMSKEKDLYEFQTPLMDWGLTLEKCIEEIESVGLPVPPKSACFFCPNQKEHEVRDLTPEERARVILIELVAEPYNKKIHGLWRRPRRDPYRPGSITQYILEQGLEFTPLTDICTKIILNPKCQKFVNGYTFAPPHDAPSLYKLLTLRGHKLPVVLTSDDPAIQGLHYVESCREAPAEVEHAFHEDLMFKYFGIQDPELRG